MQTCDDLSDLSTRDFGREKLEVMATVSPNENSKAKKNPVFVDVISYRDP